MRLKRIEAATLAEGLRRLREELGEDALILHTKTLSAGGVTGLFRRARVEILGAVDDDRSEVPAAAPPLDVATPRAVVPGGAVREAASPSREARPSRASIGERLRSFQAAVPSVPLARAAAAVPAGEPPDALPCAPSAWDRVDGRARRVAFVGPTGAGKTTTLAKVAARARLERGKRVGLVTIDTYRIGAVPQLASYAGILGVPLIVAETPGQLADAVVRASDCDLLFIDTIGRSPLGDGVEGLRPFVQAAAADEVFLVVSATTRPADSLRAAASFARLRPTGLCVTKLDETEDHGAVPVVSRATGLPLTWLGTGQGVPDDLEEAVPGRCAALAAV